MSLPAQVVIFGASGDLTSRKLIPALVRSVAQDAFSVPLQVVGVSRSDKTSEQWREELAEDISDRLKPTWEAFAPNVHWVQADAAKPDELRALHDTLDDLTESIGGDRQRSGRLFYLALAPKLFGPVVEALASEGLLTCPPNAAESWRRVVIEKPFGTDLPTAEALNQRLLTHLREDQVFRIDHYLGKETVQNILAFRFQNAIFEPLWHRDHVESVEITVSETVAMEGQRGAYYDQAGALRDMVQNHVMQVLALIAMEPPSSFDADAVRNEKVKVLRSLRPFSPETVQSDVVRAQYTASPVRERGYREEPGVDPDSMTETYVAVRAHIDSWRWSGVPFLLRTGKAMPSRYTQVILNMRVPPVDLLNGPTADNACALRPNRLRLLIQPEEGVRLSFLVKEPGQGQVMRPAVLGFDYSDMGHDETPPAYQRLLVDAIEGNATLFIRGDEVEAAWRFIDGIRDGWADIPMHTYPAGTPGPDAAEALFRGCEGTWSTGE